jgi:hypothetical protein
MAKQREQKERAFVGSQKTHIIEKFFNERWDSSTATLRNPIVTLTDVAQAILEHNRAFPNVPGKPKTELSPRNPANFLKDFIRQRKAGNRNWPKSVSDRGYTARQRKGNNACFEFVALSPGQTEPFPNRFPPPDETVPLHKIESLSLPLASRRLGRRDEPWLVQVLVRLRVIETHLAMFSKRNLIQLDHLQMSVKLRKSEIDALFLATEHVDPANPASVRELIVCCEAKQKNDDILEDQMLGHVEAVFNARGVQQDLALPIAVKVVGKSRVQVVEFDVIHKQDASTADSLTVVSQAVYELVPPVPGIGK